MGLFEADNFVQRLGNAQTVAEVAGIFTEIDALPAVSRSAILTFVDKFVAADLRVGIMSEDELADLKYALGIMEAVKDTPEGQEMIDEMAEMPDVAGGPVITRLMVELYQRRGEKSDPIVKFYAQEALKMTEEERASPLGTVKLLVAVGGWQIYGAAQDDKPVPPQQTQSPKQPKPGNFDL